MYLHTNLLGNLVAMSISLALGTIHWLSVLHQLRVGRNGTVCSEGGFLLSNKFTSQMVALLIYCSLLSWQSRNADILFLHPFAPNNKKIDQWQPFVMWPNSWIKSYNGHDPSSNNKLKHSEMNEKSCQITAYWNFTHTISTKYCINIDCIAQVTA